MNAETRAVIAVVLEALDIPYAATVGHDEIRAKILGERLRHTLVALQSLADDSGSTPGWVEARLAYLRERLAEHRPVGYVTGEEARRRVAEGADWSRAVALPDEEAGR